MRALMKPLLFWTRESLYKKEAELSAPNILNYDTPGI